MDQAENVRTIGDGQRSAAISGDAFGPFLQRRGRFATLFLDKADDCIGSAFAQAAATHIDAAHARVR